MYDIVYNHYNVYTVDICKYLYVFLKEMFETVGLNAGGLAFFFFLIGISNVLTWFPNNTKNYKNGLKNAVIINLS